MRLNWFSPLPPAQTDIAHYTARIAAALMRRFEVEFWTDLDADLAALPPGAAVRRFDPSRTQPRDFSERTLDEVNVYNIGNNAWFHAGIARVARLIPGVLILHDARLHHLIFGIARDHESSFAGYISLARKLYGKAATANAKRVIAQDELINTYAEAMPFTEPFLENALGVVCHSQATKAQARQRSDAPLLTLPLPFMSLGGPASAMRAWRPPWRLVVFGYLAQNRRLESVLRALASWRTPDEFRLDVYGSLWNPQLIEGLIEACGLQARVTIHGFAPEPELDAAIAGAHLAFHLRHPTMGEASGSVLRSWALATPTVVTDAEWYADLPNSVALKVSVADEASDILRILSELAGDPSRFERIGLAARLRLLRLHSPDAYAEQLHEALNRREPLVSRLVDLRMRDRIGDRAASDGERIRQLERTRTLMGAMLGPGR